MRPIAFNFLFFFYLLNCLEFPDSGLLIDLSTPTLSHYSTSSQASRFGFTNNHPLIK